MKPIIGVSANVGPANKKDRRAFTKGAAVQRIQQQYLDFVEVGGGIPVIIPVLKDSSDAEKLISGLDGLIATGGVDVHPTLYGEENSHSKGCNLSRDASEGALVKEALSQDKPLLGICRGMQIMNVALGGSLHQEINVAYDVPLQHTRQDNWDETIHTLKLIEASILEELFPTTGRKVNSSHHQSVNKPGEGLVIAGEAEDGVVEVIIMPGNNKVLGVQWHPERILHMPGQTELAKWFVSISHS